MYKLKINDKLVEEYSTDFEAKRKALRNFRIDESVTKVQVLNEDDEVIFSKERGNVVNAEAPVEDKEEKVIEVSEVEEEKPTNEEVVDKGKDLTIRDLISLGWDTLNKYEVAITTFAENEVDDETIKVLHDIVNDINIHLGLLESCLSE